MCRPPLPLADELIDDRMELLIEIERLKRRIEDAELSLNVFDPARSSEYWLRHPEPPSE